MTSRRRKRQQHRSDTPAYNGPPAPAIAEWMRVGWSRRDAEHLGTIEFALDEVEQLPGSAETFAKHASIALDWQPVLAGAQMLYTDPDRAEAWRLLARASTGRQRSRFTWMAACCEGNVITVEPDQVASLVTPEDAYARQAAAVAEAAGDFAKALDLLEQTVHRVDDGWVEDLRLIVAGGDTLQPHQWGKFITSAALRFCLEPFYFTYATEFAAVVLQALGATAEQTREQIVPRAYQDQTIHDALLFDSAGLAAFLETRLSADVAARCPGIASWPDAAISVHRLDARTPDGLAVVRDLVTGDAVTIGDPQLAREHPDGRCFYGRVATIEGEPHSFFAFLPTIVDDLTAARAVRAIRDGVGPDQRLAALHSGLPRESPESPALESAS